MLEAAHHQERRVRFTPIVEHRHDLRVLQRGDQLRLGFESADEVWIVGEFGSHDLDGDLPADRGLEGPVEVPTGAVSDFVSEFVAANRQPRLVATRQRPHRSGLTKCRVVEHDPLLEFGQSSRGVEAEFLGQSGTQRAERTQCIALAAREVEREHEVPGEALPEGMLADEALEFADQLTRAPGSEVGIHAVLDGGQAQLLQPLDLG